MKASEVLALVSAGYSKAEIEAMELESPAPEPVPTPTEPTPAPAPAQIVKAPEPSIGVKPEGVFLSETQFNTILQSLKAGNAKIDVPPAYDVNAVLGEHFKSLMLGEGGNKNE